MCLSTIFYAGAIGALIVCALFISLHLLKFLDLSCEGSYALGCMSFCAMDTAGYNIVVCFITAIFSASLSVIAALTCALFFRLNKKLQNGILVRLVPLVPMAVSSVIIGYGLIIFLQFLGMLNKIFINLR